MAFRALLSTVLLLNFVLCDTEIGFIFPPNATAYDDPTISNVSVHFKDSMTLEYQLPDTSGQVVVFQECYASVKAMQEEEGTTYENADTFNNTGALHWNVGDGNYGNHTGIGLCRLSISNYTIINCAWGPWGILNWNQTEDTLLYSQLFNISEAKSGTKPSLVTNSHTATASRSIATAASVTCPPSGIPAMPIYTPVPVVEQIPPMADNVTIPS